MTKPPEKGSAGARAKSSGIAAQGRRDRQAAALRENLRRRKAQARGRSRSDAAPEAAPEVGREAGAGANPGDRKRDSGAPKS
jgi:hypothetical protein